MTEYTIGAVFTSDLKNVLLIKKQKPDWQKGRFNFPGGKLIITPREGIGSYDKRRVDKETPEQCIQREFKEETDLDITTWKQIGWIKGNNFLVHLLTALHAGNMSDARSTTDEHIMWFAISHLPDKMISNLKWLIPFAIDFYNRTEPDQLIYGQFYYE